MTSSKHPDSELFKMVEAELLKNEEIINNQIEGYFKNASKEEQTSTGISVQIIKEKALYLNDFELVRDILLDSGSEKSMTTMALNRATTIDLFCNQPGGRRYLWFCCTI